MMALQSRFSQLPSYTLPLFLKWPRSFFKSDTSSPAPVPLVLRSHFLHPTTGRDPFLYQVPTARLGGWIIHTRK